MAKITSEIADFQSSWPALQSGRLWRLIKSFNTVFCRVLTMLCSSACASLQIKNFGFYKSLTNYQHDCIIYPDRNKGFFISRNRTEIQIGSMKQEPNDHHHPIDLPVPVVQEIRDANRKEFEKWLMYLSKELTEKYVQAPRTICSKTGS